jgi:hypothetical protein
MDTMHRLWEVEESEGQRQYGEDYHAIEYFIKWHYIVSVWPESDHIHEGMGFLTQHIKITNAFQKSLQSRNSSISLPYWDGTAQ